MRKYLYFYRKKNNKSMREMAELMDICLNYYDNLEKGRKGDKLTLNMASKIATVLNISLEDILILENDLVDESVRR